MVKQDDIGRNPLVHQMPEDTLDHCLAVLSFLQWTKTIDEPDVELGGAALAGEYHILSCVKAALRTLGRARDGQA